MSLKKFWTWCCGNRGHAPHLNRIMGVQHGWSRRAGPAPRAHQGPPNTLNPDPALGQNLGRQLTFWKPHFDIVTTSTRMFSSTSLHFRSRSRRHSNHRFSRSRSRSHSHRRKSRSRSYSPEYRRRRSQSTSPMSNRRRHAGSRVSGEHRHHANQTLNVKFFRQVAVGVETNMLTHSLWICDDCHSCRGKPLGHDV